MSKLSIRVYYEDTDAGGVVYYANYLKYIERGRSEMLREVGCEQDKISKDFGVLFVVRSVMANYLKPAKFNDLLEVQTEILARSEEHTSELQSQAYLVCRLLLEKKKNIHFHL